MLDDNYPKAYREVYEILQYLPRQDLEKIPKEVLQTIENKMDKQYLFKLDENIKFENQNFLRETKALLAIIFKSYWATDKQKEVIIEKENYDKRMQEKNNKSN